MGKIIANASAKIISYVVFFLLPPFDYSYFFLNSAHVPTQEARIIQMI